jgi:hypothetical protein
MCADPKHRPALGFHGVTAKGIRWQARIHYDGKNRYIGTFDTKQEAALAYDRAAREHGDGKQRLNYESIEAAEEAAAQGFHGVTAKGKRWLAGITYGGKNHHIGTFDTKQEAALAYEREAREHGGGKKKSNYAV